MNDEQMRDYLEFKGYEVTDSLDLMAKAEALGYEYDEETELWTKEAEPTMICCICEHEQKGGNNCEECGSDKLENVDAFEL